MTVQAIDRMSNRPTITIKLASTSDELLQCYALRAAVFMGEQQCPYWEEFDGNDYSASHLMLYVDGAYYTMPKALTAVVGSVHSIGAPLFAAGRHGFPYSLRFLRNAFEHIDDAPDRR